MPFPQIPEFESLLSSLTVTQPSEPSGYRSLTISEATFMIDTNGTVEVPKYMLWYTTTSPISIDALRRKLQEELRYQGHKASDDVTAGVLALFSLCPRHKDTAVACMNQVLQAFCKATLSQYYLFPGTDTLGLSFRSGEFSIGRLDASKLRYRCEKARSNYYEKRQLRLLNRLAIERDLKQVRLVDWRKPLGDHIQVLRGRESTRTVYTHVLNFYFQALSSEYTKDFWKTFLKEQDIIIAAGGPYLNERDLAYLPGNEHIAIFMGIGDDQAGFVVPTGLATLHFDFKGADERVPAVQRLLKESFGFNGFDGTELDQTIKTFVAFVSRAKRHVWDSRVDEGFLHFVIALDLLFGEKDSSTKSVTKRVAIITHQQSSKPFLDQIKEVQDIYDARSRYVHAGKSIPDEMVEKVETLCKEVLWTLLRLHFHSSHSWVAEGWLKKLDFLVSAAEAQIPVDDKSYEVCGIAIAN